MVERRREGERERGREGERERGRESGIEKEGVGEVGEGEGGRERK